MPGRGHQRLDPWHCPAKVAQALAAQTYPLHDAACQTRTKSLQRGHKFQPHRHGKFRRRRGRGGPQVRGVVDQRGIRLMPDGADQRNVRPRRRPHDDLFVKAPKILQRPAAPRHNQHIGARDRPAGGNCVETLDRRRNLRGAVLPLHSHRPDQHMARKAVTQAVQNVPDHRATGRGHHPNDARQIGDRLFSPRIEQPFGPQRGLALFQHRHQRARACRGHILDNQLILRLAGKGGHPPGGDNLHPLLRADLHPRDLPFPAYRGNHRTVVLEVKIQMARGRA